MRRNQESGGVMLDFRNDRLDYGRLLIPQEGCRLERAVAATYSLDLNTLLSIPVALFYSQTLEGRLQGERFQLLEAIQRTAGSVTVYYQNGQIHVPERHNRLFAFMEQMIVPVKRDSAFSSFHPKVWVLRYRREDGSREVFYRVLILSRNLTADRNWDLAVALEGKVSSGQRRDNRPLVDFLMYLNGIRPFADCRRFVGDLAKVRFDLPEHFDRLRFHPIGIPGYTNSPVLPDNADEALCMSPFVDDDTIRSLREHVQGKLWLFSRRTELEQLQRATVRGCLAHCLSDRVVEGEREVDDGAQLDCLPQDLHAKLFVFQQAKQTRWLVGSANATKAARERNIEFMVELTGRNRTIALDSARDDLLDPKRALNVFETFPPELAGKHDPQAGRSHQVRRLEYDLANAPLAGSLALAADQINHDLSITLDLRDVPVFKGLSLSMALMNRRDGTAGDGVPMLPGQVNKPVFANLAEADLSRFVCFTIRAGDEILRHFLLQYEISGLPPTRLDRIVKEIISNTDQFFAYLRFLLTNEFSKADLRRSPTDRKRGLAGENGGADSGLPLFESMVVAASRDPDLVRAADGMIQRLKTPDSTGKSPVPPAFLDFWEVFRPMISGKETGGGR